MELASLIDHGGTLALAVLVIIELRSMRSVMSGMLKSLGKLEERTSACVVREQTPPWGTQAHVAAPPAIPRDK